MDQPLRCNILIRYSRVSFGQALLFLVLFRVEFAQSNQCINSALFLFATLQGLSEGGGMEAGRGKGGRNHSRKKTVFAAASGLNQWVWQSRATTPWAIYRSQQALDTPRPLFYRCLATTWGWACSTPPPSALPLAVLPLCVALRPFILPSGKFPQSDQRYCSWRTFPDNNF